MKYIIGMDYFLEELSICFLQQTHINNKDMWKLKVNGGKKVQSRLMEREMSGVTVPKSDNIDIKSTKSEEVGHQIRINGSIQQTEVTIIM